MKYTLSIIYILIALYLLVLSVTFLLNNLLNSFVNKMKTKIAKRSLDDNRLSLSSCIKKILTKEFSIKLIHNHVVNFLRRRSYIEQIIYIIATLGIIALYSMVIIPSSLGVNGYLAIICITCLCLMCLYTIAKDSSEKSITNSILQVFCLYIVIFIVGMAALFILVVLGKDIIRLRAIFGCLIFFLVFTFFCFLKATEYFNNKLIMLFVTLSIYIIIIGFSSFVFGLYYHEIFKINIIEIKSQMRNNEMLKVSKQFVKFGMQFFYNYPDNEYICKVSIAQYMIGKLLDVFTLGYIFAKVTESKNRDDMVQVKQETELKSNQEVAATVINSDKLNLDLVDKNKGTEKKKSSKKKNANKKKICGR